MTRVSKQNAIKYLERKSFPGWDACSDKPSSRNLPMLLETLSSDLEKVLDLADTIIENNENIILVQSRDAQ